ncbi:MAG TPA: transcription antitermination factor NusB [Patescibacteria group bacterium]|nr:transcription antitermination factor NusB [Patescibacteria group bacterium]
MGGRPVRPGSDLVRSRRAARRLALAALFEAEFGQRAAPVVLERHLAESEGDPATARHARLLVDTAVANRDRIDARIEAAAPQYPVATLARMDRVLLRVGICEVLHSPATPARVAIAEWVELARVYGGDPARRLVNGVLGRVARDVAAEAPKSHPEPRSTPVPDPQA